MPLKFLSDSNQINRDKWKDLLVKSLFASPFQTPEYYDSLSRLKDYNASVFALSDSDKIKVLMVVTIMKEPGFSGFFSCRGIIFGGPVIFGASEPELIFFLTESANRLKGKVIYLETRNLFNYSFYKNSFSSSNWSFKPYLNIILNLEGVTKEKISALFKYNRRREIKQSILNGATYYLCTKDEEIKAVYQILMELYHENVKLPLPSFNFFYEFFKSKVFKVFVVKHNEKIIGGSFCPILPGKGLYTFYYCGLRSYNLSIFPTHLAILAALEYAVDNNIPNVDFMGAGKPGIEYGVRKYKLEFGGDLVEHGRYIKILNPFLYKIGKLGLKVLKIIH